MTEDNELMLDVGQANELKLAFRKAGWKNADIKKLCEGNNPERTLLLVREQVELNVIAHIVDCDAHPTIPKGYNWTVEPKDQLKSAVKGTVKLEKKGDDLYLNGEKVIQKLVKKQTRGGLIVGTELRKELTGEKVLDANVLDYLLAHPELIPESWKKDSEGRTLYTFFWGTIFRNSGGGLYVRYLYFSGGQWGWSHDWLDYGWRDVNPAAVLAS